MLRKLESDRLCPKKSKSHIDRVLGKYKSEEIISLIERWTDSSVHKKILKTDLYEEAFGEDQILFSLSQNAQIFGLDISQEVVENANIRNISNSANHNYLRADVRNLPFKNNIFDLIISTSTLDHFSSEDDLIKSLLELKRTSRAQGLMIITLNNKRNLNFYLMLKLGRLFGLIPYPVQFYSLQRLKKIFNDIGLSIQDYDSVVHIISPINRIMLLLRKFIKNETIDKLSERCILFFRWLNNKRRIRTKTAWFIALKCKKNNSKLDILLINPPYSNQSYVLNVPLGLCYMASILEKEGLKVKVLDLQVEKIDLKEIINSYKPQAVGISGTTQTRFESFKIAKLVKSIDSCILTIYGGYHATAAAEDTLKHIDSIDIIIRGEGEWILRDLLNEIKDNAFANLDKIDGISYRKNGTICHRPSHLRNEDLDKLPYQIRHFVDHTRYRFHLPFKNQSATTIISSRGCIMDCIFCSVGSFSTKNYVTRSNKNVCDEIEWLKNTYGIKHFFFCDNNISLDQNYINNLCDEMLERKLDILWECKVRVDTIDFDILKKMQLAGCYIVAFGVESASERILKIINKNIEIRQIERLFNWARSLGILTKPFFVLGHPTETFQEAQDTLDFIESHRKQISMFELYPCITIYPGTEIQEWALKEGFLPKDFSWSKPYYCRENISLAQDPYTPIFIQPQLGFRELKMLYYSFLRKSIFKPRFLWEKIRRVRFQSQASKYLRVIRNIVFSR